MLTRDQAIQYYVDSGWDISAKPIPEILITTAMENLDPADPLASVPVTTPVATDAEVNADAAAADAESKKNEVIPQIIDGVAKVAGEAIKGGLI